MSTTIARRIRRIGLLPTTFKEIKEEVLAKNEAGVEVAVTRTKRIPVRHSERIEPEDREHIAGAIRALARAERKKKGSK